MNHGCVAVLVLPGARRAPGAVTVSRQKKSPATFVFDTMPVNITRADF